MTINTQTIHDNLANKYGAMGSDRFDRMFISAVNRSLNDMTLLGHVTSTPVTGLHDDVDIDADYEAVLVSCINYYLQLDGQWSVEDKRDYNAERINGLRTLNMQYYLDGVEDETLSVKLGDLS